MGAIDEPLLVTQRHLQGRVARATFTSIRSILVQTKYKTLWNTTIRDIILIAKSPIQSILQGGLLGISQSLRSMESNLHTGPTSVLNCVL